MSTPNRNRGIVIASAIVVATLLLAAGVIGTLLASDGDDEPGGRAALDTVPTPTVPTPTPTTTPTTIDDHRAPDRRTSRRRETVVGATVTLTPYVELCGTTVGLPACVRHRHRTNHIPNSDRPTESSTP